MISESLSVAQQNLKIQSIHWRAVNGWSSDFDGCLESESQSSHFLTSFFMLYHNCLIRNSKQLIVISNYLPGNIYPQPCCDC